MDENANRLANKYFSQDDEKEKRRLGVQERILSEFEAPFYEHMLEGRTDMAVLDVGSNEGAHIVRRMGSRSEVSHILGVEVNPDTVKAANDRFGSDRISFRCADCETQQLGEVLDGYLREIGRPGFDVIHLSMLLLHLQDPQKLLTVLRSYLAEDGVLFIKDTDDGLNIAYPDPEGMFRRAIEICDYLEITGFRKTGRQIPFFLTCAGYRDIELCGAGISTAGMDREARNALFEAYFSFIREDANTTCERHPFREKVKADRDWIFENYEAMREAFLSEGFFFHRGYMIFTARK